MEITLDIDKPFAEVEKWLMTIETCLKESIFRDSIHVISASESAHGRIHIHIATDYAVLPAFALLLRYWLRDDPRRLRIDINRFFHGHVDDIQWVMRE